ncbi:mechanosensitive ion channel family protein [Pseudooctadecabacter jejudonensis]|uniref:Mechanosensitive channel MscK n=1 Tax=Pseudooctadecabacter jejudonensis TaxID=1391910 RepID=A0A1Y5S2U3_9RHOB|nr:mechanosensitive ion channel domain-containing protein [Pseudooctadecabacter jejudonensis]SLN30822.1 Mechanosensitive channel MscK precursor [Pseudooctadecabacter jejudonensis]
MANHDLDPQDQPETPAEQSSLPPEAAQEIETSGQAGAEAALEQIAEVGQSLATQGLTFLETLIRPWNFYQLLIALGAYLASLILRRWLAPKLHEWLRSREGWPKWRLRIALVVHKRLGGILFVALIWVIVVTMQAVTWPSRSYLLGLIATLATAWLFVAFATRLIGNPFLRTLVRYGAWVYVTLNIIGITDEMERLLDSIAIELGDTRISIWLVLQAVFILGVFFFVARFLSTTTSARIQRNEDISPSMQVLAVKFLQVLLYGAAFFIGLRAVGFDLTGLAVLSGAIGVGLGFGLQKVVSNLVSGVIILLDKSIKPGDVITVGSTFGWINSLGARYVSITTRDGREYLIPNEDLITTQVVNWSHSNDFVRLDIYFGTAYGDNPHEVRKLAIEAATSVDRVLEFRPPVCHIVGFGDSSVDYILRFWIKDPTGGLTNIRGNVYLALWDAFEAHGISIPFPQREVKVLEGSELAHKALD